MIKDSGTRLEFESGAVRDIKQGVGRMDLLPMAALIRLSKHYEEGAKKYGEYNWQKGIPMHSYIDSAMRHIAKYVDGQNDEDHLCAATWNLMCAMWTEEKKPEMQDIPTRIPHSVRISREIAEILPRGVCRTCKYLMVEGICRRYIFLSKKERIEKIVNGEDRACMYYEQKEQETEEKLSEAKNFPTRKECLCDTCGYYGGDLVGCWNADRKTFDKLKYNEECEHYKPCK